MQVDFNAQIVRKPQPKPMPAVGSPSTFLVGFPYTIVRSLS